jgi:DNA-binding CsgD family transcriptional regulator
VPTVFIDETAAGVLDRTDELLEIDRSLRRVLDRDGHVLLVEGPPGIGKTALLRELRRRATSRVTTVLHARGGELEHGFGFGVVRQLLEAHFVRNGRGGLLTGAARLAEPVFSGVADVGTGTNAEPFAALHGLYWLVATIADAGPLVLVVDDVHWADEPSLRFLRHLATRLDGMPVLLVLAARPDAEARSDPLVGSLLLEAREAILRPRPLGRATVGRLVGRALGSEPGPALVAACHDASGGNPFLLAELLLELRQVDHPGPATVLALGPERVSSAILRRVGRLAPEAPALARSAAVLGDQARLAECAELAGLGTARAVELAAGLADLAVLEHAEPLRFVHPVVRTAVYRAIPVVERGALHARAAKLLASRGVDPEQVAVHLLATTPSGDADVADALREAARLALRRGAPDSAVTLLRRALDEPPDTDLRPHLLLALGTAEHELSMVEARRHLREAAETGGDPLVRARALAVLAVNIQLEAVEQRANVESYTRAADEVRDLDPLLASELEAARLGALLFNPDLHPRFEDEADRFRDAPTGTAGGCLLLSFALRAALGRGAPVDEVGDLAERAAAHPQWERHTGNFWRVNTVFGLIAAERFDLAEQLLGRALEHATRAGSSLRAASMLVLRGTVRQRRGDLRGAEGDLRSIAPPSRPAHPARPATVVATLVEVYADQGRIDDGEAVLRSYGHDIDDPSLVVAPHLLLARGRLRAAAGQHLLARPDLELALHRYAQSRWLIPGHHETRVALSATLHALGEDADADAAELAGQTLRDAEQAGSRRHIGGALRVCGLLHGGSSGLQLLERAVDVLIRSPSQLWRAEALVDLGTAQRRAGHQVDARATLRTGLEIVERCGARPLAERAGAELRAAGARPRRAAVSGVDALTASERRVAELAASGKANKDIAQALFVTLRTVELHLSNGYRKLGITSRHELAAAIRPSPDSS